MFRMMLIGMMVMLKEMMMWRWFTFVLQHGSITMSTVHSWDYWWWWYNVALDGDENNVVKEHNDEEDDDIKLK